MTARTVFIATALAVSLAALWSQDWTAIAGVAGWLLLVGVLHGKSDGRAARLLRPASPLDGLRRWRTMLTGLGALTVGVHVLAVDRLAAQQVGVLPALLTAFLAAAIAAWVAWTQQEIRRRVP